METNGGAPACRIALVTTLLDSAQALLLRRQFVSLCREMRSNGLYLALERPGTPTEEPTTGADWLDSTSERPLHLAERFSGEPHVPPGFEHLEFRLRHTAAMLDRLLTVPWDLELLDECRGVFDKHRQNRLRGTSEVTTRPRKSVEGPKYEKAALRWLELLKLAVTSAKFRSLGEPSVRYRTSRGETREPCQSRAL